MTTARLVWKSSASGATPGRIRWVDAGKGIAISLVVLYHAAQWLDDIPVSTAGWQDVNAFLATMRMPLFFLLSGLFAAKWARVPFRELWNSKLRLFVWVFLLWEVIGLGAFVLGQYVHGIGVNWRGQAVAMLLSPIVPRFELWFIWALALYFVIIWATRNANRWLMMAVALVASIVAFTGILPLPSPSWTGLLKYFVFFLAGMYGRKLVFAYADRSGILLRVAAVVAWGAITWIIVVNEWMQIPAVQVVDAVLGIAAGIAISQSVQHLAGAPYLGGRTLPVYVSHSPIIILFAALIALLPWSVPEGLSAALLTPVVAILAIVLALGLDALSKRVRWLTYAFEPPPVRTRAR